MDTASGQKLLHAKLTNLITQYNNHISKNVIKLSFNSIKFKTQVFQIIKALFNLGNAIVVKDFK